MIKNTDYIKRIPEIKNKLEVNKVLLIFGPRQVGKSFLVNKFIEESGLEFLKLSGEELVTKSVFSVADSKNLLYNIGKYKNIYIDEAQLIPNIGRVLKLLVDLNLGLSFIVTGSSSFELMGQVGEPLVGRFNLIDLFPLSFFEVKNSTYSQVSKVDVDNFLLFGGYPAVVKEKNILSKIEILKNISNSYLLKDLFVFEKIKKPEMLLNLLKLLAYQIGNEVNINELAIKLEVRNETVERYVDILEKSFIIFKLFPYSNNLRNEIKKKYKIYFYDLGIRNALIDNFANLNIRNDIGALWKNFLVVERKKRNSYNRHYSGVFFWREVSGGEVDYIEIYNSQIDAYEFAYNNLLNKKKKIKKFIETYKPGKYDILDRDNFEDFLV